MIKYRIMGDAFLGYEVQFGIQKKRYHLFRKPEVYYEYKQMKTNTHESIEQAEAWAKKYAHIGQVVKEGTIDD